MENNVRFYRECIKFQSEERVDRQKRYRLLLNSYPELVCAFEDS
jgi:hypothetical protein